MNNIVPKLPTTVAGWEDIRKGSLTRSDSDRLEELHLKLVTNESYLGYIEAYDDAESKEGSMSIDNVFAAQKLRDKAVECGDTRISNLKIRTIVRLLGNVLRRHNSSRKQRANLIGGVVLPPDNNGE